MGILRPAIFDITIQAGGTFEMVIELGFDCSTKTVLAQMWNEGKTRKLLDFALDPLDLTIGRYNMRAVWGDTRQLALDGVTSGTYDVLVIHEATPGDDRDYYLRGQVTVEVGNTEEAIP